MKKGEIVWSKLATIILVLMLLVILLIAIYGLRDHLGLMWDKIMDFIRIGGG